MTRDEMVALVCNAGIACNATAKLIDVDARLGGVLIHVDPAHEADSVEAWLCRFGPATCRVLPAGIFDDLVAPGTESSCKKKRRTKKVATP